MATTSTTRRQGDATISTYVLVGCGQQKQNTDKPVPAKDLYTSNYFRCKQRYAEAVSRPAPETVGYTILSAKHDILWPHIAVEPYDTTIEELEEEPSPVAPDAYQHTRYPWDEPEYHTRQDFWTRRVHYGLASWLGFRSGFPEDDPHCQQLIVLASDHYTDPLLEHDVFEPFPWDTRFPFREHDFDGMGKQMQWLTDEADRLEEYTSGQPDTGEQAVINRWISASESDLEQPDVDGQTAWQDWL